eukprot:3068490-Prymnesium_polylepis.1
MKLGAAAAPNKTFRDIAGRAELRAVVECNTRFLAATAKKSERKIEVAKAAAALLKISGGAAPDIALREQEAKDERRTRDALDSLVSNNVFYTDILDFPIALSDDGDNASDVVGRVIASIHESLAPRH